LAAGVLTMEPIDINKERKKRLLDLPEMGPEYDDAGPPMGDDDQGNAKAGGQA